MNEVLPPLGMIKKNMPCKSFEANISNICNYRVVVVPTQIIYAIYVLHWFIPRAKTGEEIIPRVSFQASVGEAGAVLKSGTEADGKSKKGSFGANKNSG